MISVQDIQSDIMMARHMITGMIVKFTGKLLWRRKAGSGQPLGRVTVRPATGPGHWSIATSHCHGTEYADVKFKFALRVRLTLKTYYSVST
jgi:hypothetical protein